MAQVCINAVTMAVFPAMATSPGKSTNGLTSGWLTVILVTQYSVCPPPSLPPASAPYLPTSLPPSINPFIHPFLFLFFLALPLPPSRRLRLRTRWATWSG
eukprot:861288-Rhodomonas_salina.2